MRFTEKCKRFWSLRAQNNSGFTLVELIVVIAILAILAGIAVPAYSGYVEKANIANDQSLISDVISAGETSFYSNYSVPAEASGSVYGYAVVTESGIKTDDSEVEQALIDTFGMNYGENTLKSEEWEISKALMTLNSVASMNVAGSSFIEYAGIDNLMGDVQHCASSLANFLRGGYEGADGAEKLDSFIGEGTYVQDYLDDFADNQITGDVLGNAVVFGLADQLKNDTSKASEVQANIANGNYILRNWKDNPGDVGLGTYDADKVLNKLGDENDKDLLTETAATYAALEAFSAYIGYDMQLKFTGDNTLAILGQLANECNSVVNYAFSSPELMSKATEYLNGQAAKDATAYLDIMNTVSDIKDDYKGDLVNTDLFDNAQMIDRVNSYVAFSTMGDVADDIAALFGTDKYGVAIVFTVSKEGDINTTVFQAVADPRD